MYTVRRSDEYERLFEKLTSEDQKILIRFEERLTENPFIGKQLTYERFREKKFDDKRAIFFIYPMNHEVRMLTIVNKHTQERVMRLLRKNLNDLKNNLP